MVRTVTVAPHLGGAAQQTYFGHIVSLTRSGGGYVMRFDPSWWLTGVTANAAAAASMHVHCAPRACPPVPNDYYTLDEGDRVLTFLVAPDARGTVLTTGSNLAGTPIGVAQLAKLVAQGPQAKLFEPLGSGTWIRVRNDTVRAFAQQYRP